MSKQEFLLKLRAELKGLPEADIEERIDFYSEMLDDKIEEGLTEEEAVASLGDVESIAKQIVANTPLIKIAKERMNTKVSLKAWVILLLILGAPIGLSVLVSVISAIFSVYVSVWAVIISLWAVFGSLCACVLSSIAAGTAFVCTGHTMVGIAMWGAGLCLAGLSIFAFFVCRAATNGVVLLTKKIAFWVKKCFIKKEGAK